jgi:uridine phosphorylase
MASPPILANKHPHSPSIFAPTALMREARRQKALAAADVPEICILDPDGDIVKFLVEREGASRFNEWPCYHTDLHTFPVAGERAGIVGRAVGAPFAVLIAEELFACGCRLLISVTSAGQIAEDAPPPYFVVIDRALRDEGTSYHYAEPSEFAEADPRLVDMAADALRRGNCQTLIGSSWTTDAPFRETAEAVAVARDRGMRCVEMEAAALYTFARARTVSVLCLAHVTNTMGRSEGDFEKGDAGGASDALRAIGCIVAAYRSDAAI